MNSFIKKISTIGILISCVIYTQAMENPQNGGGETQHNNINNTDNQLYTILLEDNITNKILFHTEATIDEIDQYAILSFVFYNRAIEDNQSVDYYLYSMHELISSIMQFQRNMKNDENGYYDNHKKWHTYSISQDDMQKLFCAVFEQIVLKSGNSRLQKLCSDSWAFVQELVEFANTYRDSILENSLDIKTEELLNIYNQFSNILYKHIKKSDQNL